MNTEYKLLQCIQRENIYYRLRNEMKNNILFTYIEKTFGVLVFYVFTMNKILLMQFTMWLHYNASPTRSWLPVEAVSAGIYSLLQ